MKPRFLISLLSLLLIVALAAPAFAARKTRDLVFEDEDEAAVNKVAKEANIEDPMKISVKTALELTRDGQKNMVSPDHVFKSGDRVVLRYTTNADGYVYWLAKMSSGQYAVLFPTEKTGMDNRIKKNEEHTVPVKGSFRFDDKAGTETLLMVFAPDRIPELDQAVAEANGQKGMVEDSTKVASVEESNANKRKTRDLVFEDEDDEEVNTKTQIAPKGEPFVAMYELIHQ